MAYNPSLKNGSEYQFPVFRSGSSVSDKGQVVDFQVRGEKKIPQEKNKHLNAAHRRGARTQSDGQQPNTSRTFTHQTSLSRGNIENQNVTGLAIKKELILSQHNMKDFDPTGSRYINEDLPQREDDEYDINCAETQTNIL